MPNIKEPSTNTNTRSEGHCHCRTDNFTVSHRFRRHAHVRVVGRRRMPRGDRVGAVATTRHPRAAAVPVVVTTRRLWHHATAPLGVAECIGYARCPRRAACLHVRAHHWSSVVGVEGRGTSGRCEGRGGGFHLEKLPELFCDCAGQKRPSGED
jgi:hypothetical protein